MNAEPTVLAYLQSLQWPEDKAKLARLTPMELQLWIAYQNPQELVFLGQQAAYKRFVRLHYLWPLKLMRIGYKLKAIVRRWMI